MENLGGKVAVVTGAASGIGRATATAFASEGMKVVLADIDEAGVEKVAAELAEAGHTVTAVRTDVSKSESMEALAQRAIDEYGTFHVVHLNAGVGGGGLCWTLTERDWQWILGVNLWGVINGIRAFVPRLVEQGEGHVVNTASMAGLISASFMAPYNVSKHGVVTLSETLYKDLKLSGASGVGVSVLCPGWVNTGIGDSARNRPAELQNESVGSVAPAGDMGGVLKGVLETGMDPAAVADLVVNAVKDNTFWILTHEDWIAPMEDRFTDIRERRSPTGGFLPT